MSPLPTPDSYSHLLRRVIKIGTPAVIENLIVSAVLLADALMLARLPNNTVFLAAISISSILYWRLVNLLGCTQIGSSAYIARRWGEEKFKEAGFALGHTIVIALIIGAIGAALFWPFIPIIFSLVSDGDQDVISYGTRYFYILLLAMPIRLGLLTLASGMRAAGDTRSPLVIMIFMVIANIFLNYLLIFGNWGFPALEFEGAALGTVLSYALGLAIGLVLFIRGLNPEMTVRQQIAKFRPPAVPTHFIGNDPILRLDWMGLRPWFRNISPSVLKVSVSALGEEILVTIGFMTFIGMIGCFGREALAAHSATVRIEALSYTTGWGIALATSALVGQALGAKKLITAQRLFFMNSMLAVSIMGCIGLSFMVIPEFYLSWFRLEGDVMELGIILMIIFGIEQVFIATGMTISGGLRGAGATFPPFVTQIFGVIGMRLGIGYLLGFVMGWGIIGLYWATVLDWATRSLILAYFVKRGKWMKVDV